LSHDILTRPLAEGSGYLDEPEIADPKLQNTVTRGVVSANRIMDGFSFIQSDVTVDPGNSGGPLLDEQGRVLGFTDKGLRSAEAPTGLNFFVPIDDALRFLSAEPQ
jgi:S1-C subfamily serine protease